MLLLCMALIADFGRGSSHPTTEQRVREIASQLRCPICHGETVADSTTDIARSIRVLIRQRLSRGDSPDAIKTYLASRYGQSIVLVPSTSGIGAITWIAPIAFVVGGLGVLAVMVAGWRAQGRTRPPAPSLVWDGAEREIGDTGASAEVRR
jgi:cytochrome c-type biogenesis protein CcmH